MNFFRNPFKIFAQRRMRKAMRGYRFLRETNQLDHILKLQYELGSLPLDIPDTLARDDFFGAAKSQAEKSVRQFLLLRFGNHNLVYHLLIALGSPGKKMIFPCPRPWVEFLKIHGYNVAIYRSWALWQIQLLVYFCHGFISIVKSIFSSLLAFQNSGPVCSNYAYFNSLGASNVPSGNSKQDENNIVLWYAKWDGRAMGIDCLCHSVVGSRSTSLNQYAVKYLPSPILDLKINPLIFRFIPWAIRALSLAFMSFFTGYWWNIILLNEARKAAIIRYQKASHLAKDYLFHNSEWLYRPIWTFEAEKHKSRILFYFYSTNIENFTPHDGYSVPANFWHVTSWPNYLVWDDYQSDFVSRNVPNAPNIMVVGDIWFGSGNSEDIEIPKNAIAVFDVAPHRDSKYQLLGMEWEFYVPQTCMAFLKDLNMIASQNNYSLVWKRKRKIGRTAHYKYRNLCEELEMGEAITVIDPEISANTIIEKSGLVISMPFTSTAIIAKMRGKPSCYYDPTGKIKKDDRAAHGIAIISGLVELNDWISENIKSTDNIY